jgi:predicted RNA methylase
MMPWRWPLNLVVNQPNETFGHGVTTLAEDAVYRSRRVEQGFAKLLDLDNAMPTQTNRTEEQDEFQQFSTPHTHAALMVRVANIQPDDVVLEPSAGSGNLATMAQAARPLAVVVNELAPRRAAILRALGFPLVYTENAEQLSHILGPKGLKATVVIMNPPFSASAGTGGGAAG